MKKLDWKESACGGAHSATALNGIIECATWWHCGSRTDEENKSGTKASVTIAGIEFIPINGGYVDGHDEGKEWCERCLKVRIPDIVKRLTDFLEYKED